jgi:hypothetical protein
MDDILVTDKHWEPFDGGVCRISSFSAWASVKDGKVISSNKKMPYGTFDIHEIEFQKLVEPITAYIRHSMDFAHLWQAFEVRGVADDEVAAVVWTKKHYKSFSKWFPAFLPRMIVWIFTEEGYSLCDTNYKPEFKGQERFLAMRPIFELKPPVMW